MKKVMIVDDEFLVRLGIKSLLRWEEYGYEIVAEAENGEEAMEKIERFHPQIILTDLKMDPGDGFELIEKCLKKYPSVKFIVLSNYNDFDNVRRAMKLGACDYVFKLTLKAEELLQILDETAGDLPVEQETERSGDSADMRRNGALIKDGILKNLLEARDGYYREVLKSLAGLSLKVNFEEGYRILTITVDDLGIARCRGNFLENDLLRFTMENMIYEIFDGAEMEVFQRQEGCFAAVVADRGDKAETFREEMCGNFRRLGQNVKKYYGLYLAGTISRRGEDIGEIRELILENDRVQNCRFWKRTEDLVWEERFFRPVSAKEGDFSAQERILAERMEKEGLDGGLDCFEEQLKVRREGCETEEWRNNLMKAYQVLAWHLKKRGINPDTVRDRNEVDLATGIRKYDYHEEILDSFSEIQEQYRCLMEKKGCRKEVEEAKRFVMDNYGEKLSVAQVAGLINMSESRFAHVFKKETGISFWEYVNQVRMNEAEKLLRETDLRVSEIAEKIGMDNPNYFSARFKERKGIGPLEYRNQEGERRSV